MKLPNNLTHIRLGKCDIIDINNKLPHGVINNSNTDRIHFICDLIDTGE